MAKANVSFNFGANARPKKGKKGKAKKRGGKSDAWRAYTTGGKKR